MRGAAVPSSALMAPMTQRFVDAIKSFAARNRIEIVSFRRGERKDDRTRQYLRRWSGGEGVLYIGKAQEKAKVVRTERRHDPATGDTYPWLAASPAMVNQFYFYAVDDDFGPFFLKFCSYFPYNAKRINGHEYLKRQLTKRGIAYESLDNGILRCSDPERLQRLADGLTAAKVDALLRKWLARLPHPFAASDRQQGIRYDVSILQAEFALTQVFDRPAQGAGLLRGGGAREPRHGSARPRAVDLRPARQPAHPLAVSHPRHHRRSHPVAARRLQALAHQAVPQGRTRPAHRDGHQRHVRLRCRPPAEEPR